MNEWDRGRRLARRLAGGAHVFSLRERGWDVPRGARLFGAALPGVGMASIQGLPAALGLATPAGAVLNLWTGLHEIGRASREGKAISQARNVLAGYFEGYVGTIAGHADLINSSSAYQPKVNADLPELMRRAQRIGIRHAHDRLKSMGEQEGRADLEHLDKVYGDRESIARAIRPAVQDYSLQNVAPRLRRYFTGVQSGNEPQSLPILRIRYPDGTVQYPQSGHTDFPPEIVHRSKVVERAPKPLRSSGRPSRITSPGSSRMIGAPPMQGPRYSFLDPVKIADWKLQMTPDRPRPITIPTGPDSALNTLRQMERRAAEREKTQGWLQGLEQRYLRPGTSSVGTRVPSLSDKGLGTGVGSFHKGSTLNRSGGFGARLSPGFSPALEGLQGQLTRLSARLESPGLSRNRFGVDLGSVGGGLFDSGFGGRGMLGGSTRLNVPGLSRPGGGFLNRLWDAGSGMSPSPPPIRLRGSASLTSGGPAGVPGMSFNPFAPGGMGGLSGLGR